jgi:hypothetical protein
MIERTEGGASRHSQKILKQSKKLLLVSPPGRAETRIPKRMLVRLWNPENAGLEITPTIDISRHGAQVVSKRFWQPNDQLLVRSIRGGLYARARVAHYRSLTNDSYMVGLHLYRPTRDWQTSVNLQKSSKTADTSLRKRSVDSHDVLTELSLLLEEYAPTWYTEEQRGRALAARRLPAEALLELVVLLEEYIPTWYTEKQRDRALAALQLLGLLD